MKTILFESLINYSSGILILRIWLGVVFIAHGAQKFLGIFGGRGYSATISGWQKIGIPELLGHIGIFTEFFGGIFLILGLLTRLTSLGIMITMLVAISLVNFKGGFFNPKGFEYPLTLLILSLIIFLFGPGKYSLDKILFRKTESITS